MWCGCFHPCDHADKIFPQGCPGIDLTARDKSGLSPFSAAMNFKNNTAAKVSYFVHNMIYKRDEAQLVTQSRLDR